MIEVLDFQIAQTRCRNSWLQNFDQYISLLASEKWELRTCYLGQIFKSKLLMVEWSIRQSLWGTFDIKKSFFQNPKLIMPIQVSALLPDIIFHLLQFWLQTLDINYCINSGHLFQTFAHGHLRWLQTLGHCISTNRLWFAPSGFLCKLNAEPKGHEVLAGSLILKHRQRWCSYDEKWAMQMDTEELLR